MSETNRTTWEFLENTYWYVKNPDLSALEFSPDSNELSWRGDQTVWHISGYKNGYFWGVSSTVLLEAGEPSDDPRRFSLIGTVTSDGQVQITFIHKSPLKDSVTTGFGHMTKQGEHWAVQMQMSTESDENRLLHWANMEQITKDDPHWEKLPGANSSMDAMLFGAKYPLFSEAKQAQKIEEKALGKAFSPKGWVKFLPVPWFSRIM